LSTAFRLRRAFCSGFSAYWKLFGSAAYGGSLITNEQGTVKNTSKSVNPIAKIQIQRQRQIENQIQNRVQARHLKPVSAAFRQKVEL